MISSLKLPDWRRSASIVLLCALCWAAAAADDLTRITSSFEYKYASPVLTRVSRQFSGGFARADVERLVNELKALPADQPKTWEFQVRYKGQTWGPWIWISPPAPKLPPACALRSTLILMGAS
jgi:hypothetical protein